MTTSVVSRWWQLLEGFGWHDLLDIGLVAVIVIVLLRVLRETRALQMLRGLGLIVLAAVAARMLSLSTTTWLLHSLLLVWAIALIIVLQPELRKLISSLGEQRFLGALFLPSVTAVHEIAEAARLLIGHGWGGLVAVERENSLAGFAESGTKVAADVKAELLATIFTPGSPLHDGAVIVRQEKVYAAGCMLPLSQGRPHEAGFGMRHRAAIGITQETDALVVVVSEEQKNAVLAKNGQLTPPLDIETLEQLLTLYLGSGKEKPA